MSFPGENIVSFLVLISLIEIELQTAQTIVVHNVLLGEKEEQGSLLDFK